MTTFTPWWHGLRSISPIAIFPSGFLQVNRIVCLLFNLINLGPFSKETHWKQTVFYLENFIPVKKGDELYGSIAVKKCKENARELDIKISYHLDTKGSKPFHKVQYYKLT